MTKVVAIALLIATVPAFTGCYGPYRLTTKLHGWNGEISNQKFVNELAFLGLAIVQAYSVCLLADGLIFNSIEFWGGNNPIAMNEGEVETQEVMHNGQIQEQHDRCFPGYGREHGLPLLPRRRTVVPNDR